jgi:3-oxoadipate enol-lactonase
MEVNGNAIAVDIFGDGTPILMFHGLGGTSNVWCAQRVVSRHFRVLCPDLEGSGRSPLLGHLSIDGFVADMATLLQTLNISSAQAAGYSLGTVICQHLACCWGRSRLLRSAPGMDSWNVRGTLVPKR